MYRAKTKEHLLTQCYDLMLSYQNYFLTSVYHLQNYEEILTIKKISEYLYEGTKCAKNRH